MATTLAPLHTAQHEQDMAERVTFMPAKGVVVMGLFNRPVADGLATLEDAEKALARLGFRPRHEWLPGLCGAYSTNVYRMR